MNLLPPRLSVIIPCYNESRRIKDHVLHCISVFQEAYTDRFEIILVNDGSKDDTLRVIKKLQQQNNRIQIVHYSQNRGKGYAVRQGLRLAKGRIVAYLDADGDICPTHIIRYASQLSPEVDIVVGSKRVQGAETHKSLLRKVLSFAAQTVNYGILGLSVKDTQVGCKVMKQSVVSSVAHLMTCDGFAFDAELLYIASRMGYIIQEQSVHIGIQESSSITLKTTLRTLQEFIQIRWRHNTQLQVNGAKAFNPV